MFLEEYAARDEEGKLDPLEVWPELPPHGYKSILELKRELMYKVYPYVTDKKNVQKSARQLVSFATRIKPISNMYWQILCGKVQGKLKKNPPQGVSTFCHLEGATDTECINFLNLVCVDRQPICCR
jgi:hypothetical protein